MASSALRNPRAKAPVVARIGSQIIFIRLAPMASPLLARKEASDRVPPMQISASGRVSCARYSPEVVSQPGRRTCQ